MGHLLLPSTARRAGEEGVDRDRKREGIIRSPGDRRFDLNCVQIADGKVRRRTDGRLLGRLRNAFYTRT